MVSADDAISENASLPQDEDVDHVNNDQEVPWKMMLYKLYGNDAELFLNADMHFKKRLNPRLLKLCGSAGSGTLFTILRNESIQKLFKQDKKLPDDLKDTYEAYVHQCVAQNRKPVPRVFCAEGNQLEKKYSFYYRKPCYEMKRRQVNLMYRLCQKNQDRAQISIFNNPLPNFNIGQSAGDSAVARYIPNCHLSSYAQNPSYFRDKSEMLELISEKNALSDVEETFLTESQVLEETNARGDDSLGRQNSICKSQEILSDLSDRSQYGCKILYLSHLIDYEGDFSSHLRKDSNAPKFLEPSKEIDIKFSREALEAVRMPYKCLPGILKETKAERCAEEYGSEDSKLTASTLLKYVPCASTPKASLLPPIYSSKLLKQSKKKWSRYNKPRAGHYSETKLIPTADLLLNAELL